MIKKVVKNVLSEKQLEKILRTKQYIYDSNVFKRKFRILPPINHRIGNEVIPVSPVSSITVQGWRSLIKLYQKANETERDEFKDHMKQMILADAASISILETEYIRNIFSSHVPVYLEFLGTAYYSKGELKKAFQVFKELAITKPVADNYLHMARCLMHFGNEEDVINLLKEGCRQNPASDKLWLSLANAYFRYGKTGLANESIQKISTEKLQDLKNKAHSLSNLENEITEVLSNKTIIRPVEKLGFQAYTEEGVQNYWETLFFHFVNRNRFQHGWSDLCYKTEFQIESYLAKYHDIKSVLNFGVFCAVPDYNLAVKHPDTNFIGVDREQSTKNYNDNAFRVNNLSFHALDMIDIIYEDREEVKNFVKEIVNKKGELMIFHARTATLIYPEAIKRFYKSCAALGVKYIALYENMCLSRSYLKYFDFDDMPADSIPYFSIMMIHNYKKFLEEAGYEIVEHEIWNYSDLLWEGKDLYGVESHFGLADGHVALLAKLK